VRFSSTRSVSWTDGLSVAHAVGFHSDFSQPRSTNFPSPCRRPECNMEAWTSGASLRTGQGPTPAKTRCAWAYSPAISAIVFGLLRWGRYVREAGAEPIEEAGLPSQQHRSLSQIKEAITKIFALTEAGSVRAVMPGACGTLAQPTKNISQNAETVVYAAFICPTSPKENGLYTKRTPSANAPEVPKSSLYLGFWPERRGCQGTGASPERPNCKKIRTFFCRYHVNLSVKVNRDLVIP
jgi:hypothetical protein